MFRWFESRLDPYPADAPQPAPESWIAFCWHYSREAAPWLIAMSCLTALVSIGEMHRSVTPHYEKLEQCDQGRLVHRIYIYIYIRNKSIVQKTYIRTIVHGYIIFRQ